MAAVLRDAYGPTVSTDSRPARGDHHRRARRPGGRACLGAASGLTVPPDPRAAVDDYDRGVRALLGFGADTVAAFEAAVSADPEFALARAGLAVSRYLNEEMAEGRVEMERAAAAAQAP